MVAFSKVALTFGFALGAFASPLARRDLGLLSLFGEILDLPAHIISQGAADASTKISVQIGLKQSNIDQLQAKLLDISNPKSANYGKWLSQAEVNALTAPPAENIDTVKSWLASAGITDLKQPTPDWIQFSADVSTLNSLLDAEYEFFLNTVQDTLEPRTRKYSIPASLHDIVDLVTPTTMFYTQIGAKAVPKPQGSASNFTSSVKRADNCDASLSSPANLKCLYNVDYTPVGKTTVGTVNIGQGSSASDFAAFTAKYASGSPQFVNVNIGSGTNDGVAHGEGNLDVQTAAGMASPLGSEYLNPGAGGDGYPDQLSAVASYLTSGQDVPSAVSISIGANETTDAYIGRVCNDFMKATSAGVTIIVSSGDGGVGNGKASCADGFSPSYPATCPWVLAVGGTQYTDGGQAGGESVAQFGTSGYYTSSGGGFSNYFAIPDYQANDVHGYIGSLNGEYSGLFNTSGRGIPDVSLAAVNYPVFINGTEGDTYEGTSASSPAWAGIVASLNDYRIANGKAPLGFINQLLYSSDRSATQDVYHGSNPGCDSKGFPAGKQWDAATGLGSINYGTLRSLI